MPVVPQHLADVRREEAGLEEAQISGLALNL
jgi:hypothetical protein